MSWDVLLINTDEEIDYNEDEVPSFGSKEEFINKISSLFPELDASDPTWLKLRDKESDDLFIDFNLGEEDDLSGIIMLCDIAGEKSREAIQKICQTFGWRIADLESGEFINTDLPTEEWFEE